MNDMPMPMDTDMIYNMQMEIKTGTDAGWVLFKQWEVKSLGQLLGALLFVFALAFISEGISFFIWMLQQRDKSSVPVAVLSVTYGILRLFNYLLMLIAMTYNIYLIVGVAASQAIVNFLFSFIKDRKLLQDSQ